MGPSQSRGKINNTIRKSEMSNTGSTVTDSVSDFLLINVTFGFVAWNHPPESGWMKYY